MSRVIVNDVTVGFSIADWRQTFDPLRPRLIRIAYRMLGSVADAEDVVQDAFLRWLDADRDAVQEPQAYLRRVITRLCLEQLKSARRRRETYIGPWAPEPVIEAGEHEIDDVTLPLMIALEHKSERPPPVRPGTPRGTIWISGLVVGRRR